jgi:phosphopantothenoylcysteine synthetase/decarboxylase
MKRRRDDEMKKLILIGFSLETDNLIKNSKMKLINKNLDMVVANGPEAFDKDLSKIHLIYRDGNMENLGKISKISTANKILDFVKTSLSVGKYRASVFETANKTMSTSRLISLKL